jgi:hypothetical protein
MYVVLHVCMYVLKEKGERIEDTSLFLIRPLGIFRGIYCVYVES